GTDRRNLRTNLERIKIDPVFKIVLAITLDQWPLSLKQLCADTLIRITDVFRHQRQQNFPIPPIGGATGQQIEKEKECRLPPAGYRHVFLADVPAEGIAES